MDTRQKLALTVPEIDDDFDPNQIPENGEDYLKKVIFERRNIPDVVKIIPTNMKPRNVEENDSLEKKINELKTVNSRLLPTIEWQRIQKEKFTENQKRVERLRENYNKDSDSASHSDQLTFIINDEEKALKYCQDNQPFLSVTLNLGQRNLEVLLSHLAIYLEDLCENTEHLNKILKLEDEELRKEHEWISKWIYSGLLCLQLPLDASTHNTLRIIAKSSIKIRNFFNVERHSLLIPFNLLICVIANNFDQLDLGDFMEP